MLSQPASALTASVCFQTLSHCGFSPCSYLVFFLCHVVALASAAHYLSWPGVAFSLSNVAFYSTAQMA